LAKLQRAKSGNVFETQCIVKVLRPASRFFRFVLTSLLWRCDPFVNQPISIRLWFKAPIEINFCTLQATRNRFWRKPLTVTCDWTARSRGPGARSGRSCRGCH